MRIFSTGDTFLPTIKGRLHKHSIAVDNASKRCQKKKIITINQTYRVSFTIQNIRCKGFVRICVPITECYWCLPLFRLIKTQLCWLYKLWRDSVEKWDNSGRRLYVLWNSKYIWMWCCDQRGPRSRPCSEGCFSKEFELQDPRNKDMLQCLWKQVTATGRTGF